MTFSEEKEDYEGRRTHVHDSEGLCGLADETNMQNR